VIGSMLAMLPVTMIPALAGVMDVERVVAVAVDLAFSFKRKL